MKTRVKLISQESSEDLEKAVNEFLDSLKRDIQVLSVDIFLGEWKASSSSPFGGHRKNHEAWIVYAGDPV